MARAVRTRPYRGAGALLGWALAAAACGGINVAPSVDGGGPDVAVSPEDAAAREDMTDALRPLK